MPPLEKEKVLARQEVVIEVEEEAEEEVEEEVVEEVEEILVPNQSTKIKVQ
jgi:hypothetical protein